MKQPNRRLMLCFTHSEADLTLALNYWERTPSATGADGWTYKTGELGPVISRVVSSARTTATAYDLNTRCPTCGAPEEITSRSVFASARRSTFRRDHRGSGQYLCNTCYVAREEEYGAAAELERLEREQQLRATIANFRPKVVPLAELGLAEQMLLLAVLRAATVDKKGNYNLSRAVVADGTDHLVLDQLRRAGAIKWAVDDKLTGWSMGVDGKLYVNFETVGWQPTCTESYGDACEYLASQTGLVAGDAEALDKLWRMVALTECSGKLQEQAEYFNLGQVDIGEKTEAAFWYALKHFSIPQVWAMIVNGAQYAAAQRQARTKVSAFAPKLIPGSITGYVDRALANQWTVYPRTRPNWHDEPTLTSLLFDRVLAGICTFQNTTITTLNTIRNKPL
jgi:hypothetical protein